MASPLDGISSRWHLSSQLSIGVAHTGPPAGLSWGGVYALSVFVYFRVWMRRSADAPAAAVPVFGGAGPRYGRANGHRHA
eukprot:7386477-Pyramimonas_sp.AAC.1